MTLEEGFFNFEREAETRRQQALRVGNERKKIFEDTFATPTGKACLETLALVLGARNGQLEAPTDPIEVVRQDTMRRVYWFIEGMARVAERREIV